MLFISNYYIVSFYFVIKSLNNNIRSFLIESLKKSAYSFSHIKTLL